MQEQLTVFCIGVQILTPQSGFKNGTNTPPMGLAAPQIKAQGFGLSILYIIFAYM